VAKATATLSEHSAQSAPESKSDMYDLRDVAANIAPTEPAPRFTEQELTAQREAMRLKLGLPNVTPKYGEGL
jgi:hypothetical protein